MRNSTTFITTALLTWIKTLAKKLIKFTQPTLDSASFLQKESPASTLCQHDLAGKNLMLITIAFNNSVVIETQWQYLATNITEPFVSIVADNSNDMKASTGIATFCAENSVPYVRIPHNPFAGDPSRSHGIALNWACDHVVKKYQPTVFGFIDHDILPFRKTTVTDKIRNGIFGLIQRRNEKWYVWPGLTFLKTSDVIHKSLDFQPCDGLDTGGSNYEVLYKNINKHTLSQLPHFYFDIEKKAKLSAFDHRNQNIVETIGDWVHLMRTSNWHGLSPKKASDAERINSIVKIISEIAHN